LRVLAEMKLAALVNLTGGPLHEEASKSRISRHGGDHRRLRGRVSQLSHANRDGVERPDGAAEFGTPSGICGLDRLPPVLER
jgi:hypothetical protein